MVPCKVGLRVGCAERANVSDVLVVAQGSALFGSGVHRSSGPISGSFQLCVRKGHSVILFIDSLCTHDVDIHRAFMCVPASGVMLCGLFNLPARSLLKRR